jgi:hypothetical protein
MFFVIPIPISMFTPKEILEILELDSILIDFTFTELS